MKTVFVSYAAQDENVAGSVVVKLRAAGVDVFCAADSLPPGLSFDDRIREAIENCVVFVFLISEDSLSRGRYALTELEVAKARWPNPAGHVLPVLLGGVDMGSVDPYLRESVTILKPRGNPAVAIARATLAMLAEAPVDNDQPSLPSLGVAHARRLRLRAESMGSPELVPVLEQLSGLSLDNRFLVQKLFEFGRQFAVYRGADLDTNASVAIKLPLVDYTRPVSYGLREVKRGRQVAEKEFQVLRAQRAGSPLPAPIALIRRQNPLHGTRAAQQGWDDEVYLVQEWIEGTDLDSLRMQLFVRAASHFTRQVTTLRVARGLFRALAELRPKVFSDPAPRNFIWCESAGRVRLVDGSSLVPEGTRWLSSGTPGRTLLPVTPAYLSGADYRAYARGEPRVASEDSALFSVGKVLHQFATNLHPLEGEDPSLDSVVPPNLSSETMAFISSLLRGECGDTREALCSIESICARQGVR